MKSAAPLLIAVLLGLLGVMLMAWAIPEYYRRKAEPFLKDFEAASAQYGLPDGLLARMAQQESGYNPAAVSSKGAAGLFQFMPSTARDFGIDPLDPSQSTFAAARYIRQLYDRFQSWREALAAYNWGMGNLERKDLIDGVFGDDLPPETQNYVSSIAGDLGLS